MKDVWFWLYLISLVTCIAFAICAAIVILNIIPAFSVAWAVTTLFSLLAAYTYEYLKKNEKP